MPMSKERKAALARPLYCTHARHDAPVLMQPNRDGVRICPVCVAWDRARLRKIMARPEVRSAA